MYILLTYVYIIFIVGNVFIDNIMVSLYYVKIGASVEAFKRD